MSKKALYLLGILLTILIGTYFYWKLCCNGSAVAKDQTEVIQEEVETRSNTDAVVAIDQDAQESESTANSAGMPFALRDTNGSFSFSVNDNFNFNPNGYAINMPVSESIHGGIDQMTSYFDTNEGKRLNITGWYTSSEENTSAYPNLGMARANAVKNYLKDRGMKGRFMNVLGAMDDHLQVSGTVYKGPISYEIVTKNAAVDATAEMEALRAKIKADPLVLNFGNAQTSINLTPAQRQKVADIARYLDKVESSKAIVTGHTDNTGSRAGNINISKKRANFAKEYLVQNGIATAQIDTSGKGPDEPVATNDTEAGRAQNRRTVVTVN